MKARVIAVLLAVALVGAMMVADRPLTIAQGSGEWVIDGDTIYIDDANAYLSATPHTLANDGWVEFELISKHYSGYLDIVWGLPWGSGVKVSRPQRWAIDVAHEVRNVTIINQGYSERVDDIRNWTNIGWSSGEVPDIGNRNNTYLVKLYLSANYTPVNIAFNSYVQHNATSATFTGNRDGRNVVVTYDYYDDWVSWNPGTIDKVYYQYAGVDEWNVIRVDQYITAGVAYRVRCYVQMPIILGTYSIKYAWAIKPSSESISDAKLNGHLYVLDPWLTGGWSYRKAHNITAGYLAGTNYQVRVKVYSGSGSDSGEDVYLNSHGANFPNDIRFTDNDGSSQLDAYCVNVSANPAVYWVEVADDLDSNASIYIYYGKAGASLASDGAGTFLFFDNYTGTSLDSSKWTEDAVNDLNQTINNYFRYEDAKKSGGTYWIYDGTDTGSQHQAKYTLPTNYSISYPILMNDVAVGEVGQGQVGIVASDNTIIVCGGLEDWWGDGANMVTTFYTEGSWTKVDMTWTVASMGTGTNNQLYAGVSNKTYYTVEFRKLGNTVYAYRDESQKAYTTISSSTSNWGLIAGAYGGYSWIDYVEMTPLIVRKYAPTEPSHSGWGSEEMPSLARSWGYILGV